MSTPQQKIQPVDAIIRAGLVQRIQSQFRCPALFTTSPDKLVALKKLLGEKQPQYPYIFLVDQATSSNPESYNSRRLSRYGIPVAYSNDGRQMQTVKLFPTNFDVELTFITNEYDSEGTGSVRGFVRRWMFTLRNGGLQFDVDYGLTSLSISSILADSVPTPPRENPTETEAVYQIVTTATVKGYVSEPAMQTRGRIQDLVLSDSPVVSTPGSQYFPFQ